MQQCVVRLLGEVVPAERVLKRYDKGIVFVDHVVTRVLLEGLAVVHKSHAHGAAALWATLTVNVDAKGEANPNGHTV